MNRPADEGLLAWIRSTVADWQRRTHDRHVLAHLGEQQRRDIGLSRQAIEPEINKPFWRA